MPFHITEPHPSVPHTSRITTGRGGAGNVSRVDLNSPNTTTYYSPPARSEDRVIHSGRGGVGNIHSSSERTIFPFDEEILRQERLTPVYHVGRGGAGNLVDIRRANGRKGSAASTMSRDSDASEKARKGLEAFKNTIERTFSRS
ncbi:hypothetical protein MMC06_003784 [Schaereria dolodes]|nr:hypothetical protein [Schaereria dolodes]